MNAGSRFRAAVASLSLAASLVVVNCSQHTQVGRDYATPNGGAANGGSSAAGSGTAGSSGDAAPPHQCQITACQNKVYQCGDCIDNDDDQRFDSDDPECTGPCDNTEDSYFGGIPGQNNAPCREDCYFDQDTGSGNDQCYWHQGCDPLSVAPDFPPSGDAQCGYDPGMVVPGSGSTCAELSAVQSGMCASACLPITPNGCDCFGCCELPADSGQFVWIGSATKNEGTCDAAHVSDPSACHPCTPVPSCFNRCEACEICVGRTAPSPDCATPSVNRCPPSQAACGQPGEADCAAGYYCITGCCAEAPR